MGNFKKISIPIIWSHCVFAERHCLSQLERDFLSFSINFPDVSINMKVSRNRVSKFFSIKVTNQIQITGNFFLSSKTTLEMFRSYLGVKNIFPDDQPPQVKSNFLLEI